MTLPPGYGGILVTGGSGQLARALTMRAADRVHVVGRPEFDFDQPDTLDRCLQETMPSLVINAAAWTAVDLAESEPAAAARANTEGPAHLARLCQAASIPLIHVSTDYVFDGGKGSPYVETDPTSPTGVYGRTKLEGEQAVTAGCSKAVIARTSWVYAPTGKNFVRTMLAAAGRPVLKVVGDQQGCPTAAADLADALLEMAAQLQTDWREELAGVFHVAGAGSTSWHGLAAATFEAAARHGLAAPELHAITTAEWPTPARRPADSRLNCDRLARVFGITLPPWRRSLDAVVDAILSSQGPEARPASAV